ncbi:hypothetical protein [Gallaecimonas mangrovi]|uniref:hypothetical protein n=1 Tax=Gallaecimonas mangrovi TaxID=2291597 RepID=UPI000E1FDE91|nr:hypothetical protein [Gallaecimonas mangrovi]
MPTWLNKFKLDYFETLALASMSFVLLILAVFEATTAAWLPLAIIFAASGSWFAYRHLLRPGRAH